MELISTNPSNGDVVQTWPVHSESDVSYILGQAEDAYKFWKTNDLTFRLDCLGQLADLLRDRAREYGIIMAEEMGKPLAQGVAEAEKCAWLCDYYCENAASFLEPKEIDTGAYDSFVAIEPIGLVLGVMPWNFPFWQVFRFAVPTVTAGNGAILKHASNVQGCASIIESVFLDAGYPENLFRNLSIPGSRVNGVIEHPAIAAVTLTGSTSAGKAVAAKAGECLKKTVLELGGSDPYVILDDANMDQAVAACTAGRMLNAGQSCIAAKRLIVTRKNESEFIKSLQSSLELKIMGDPMDDVDIGPMVSIDARDELHEQVKQSVDAGATLLLGGEVPDGDGSFYPPTLLTDVRSGMPAFNEELFGPVFVVIVAAHEDEALELANQTEFGLGSAVFTTNIKRGTELAKNYLQAGACFVNDFVKSDPRLPFGGIKASGYGRELSAHGMMEFVNIKTVVVKLVGDS
ncbi:MAG: NAD-dependent succinate-semialdehyde dehydrogenase [Candidatus Neomarinimicrobiota bacterium]|nr:NAD-dependent succinate-semialdehyde dehydrogenase [Candidatus Neomarinimicrobiota bacterium]